MGFDPLIIFFATYFPYLVGLVFVVLAFRQPFVQNRARFLLEGLLSAFVARGLVELIRIFIHRPRPFVADPSLVALISENSYSFPSGHAAFFFALSTVVYMYDKRAGVWFFLASAVLSIARIMAGVHYPTDILGGAVLGIIVGFGVHLLFKRYRSRQQSGNAVG